MKVELIQSNKMQRIKNSLFLAAYTIWMLRAFLNTTFFYSAPWFQWWKESALSATLFVCLACVVFDFSFEIREVGILFLVCLMYWVSYATGSHGFAVSIVLMYAARRVAFDQIAKWTVVLQTTLLVFVVTSSLLGVIENHIFVQAENRVRYGLGFLYCSYTSHYLLLFFMLYLVLQKKILWFQMILLLLVNAVGFIATDTKTDIISLALMGVMTFILRAIYQKKRILRGISYVAFSIPFVFWMLSLWVCSAYDFASPMWQRLDGILNQRVKLGYHALQMYPIRMFGQKIKWVGGSAMVKDPSLVYNYVDNNYVTVTLQMGAVLAFFMCFLYGRAIYLSIQKKQLALAAALFVFMVIGLVNPEMRNLLYNTFWLVLLKPSEQFETIESWIPREKREKRDG